MKYGVHIVACVLALAALAFAGCGGEATREANDPYELLTILGDVANRPRDLPGRWRPAQDGSMGTLTAEERAKLEEMGTLPYMGGSTEAPEISNITVYDPEATYDGLNVYTSGHAPEAFLMDMEGNVLHKWAYAVEDVWPEVPRTIHSTFWRRIYPYPNGDLLAIFEGIGMLKLDKDSNLLWAYHGGTHHEAWVADDGDIYVLTRKGQIIERINPTKPVLPDAITVLSPDGEVKKQVPVLEAFERSNYRRLLMDIKRQGDLFHTNSVYVFDGSLEHLSPHFKKGNVLTSLYKLDVVAIVDMDTGQVVWAHSGRPEQWVKQHHPRALENGNILVFDNQGRDGKSRVVEFDVKTGKFVWQYPGDSGAELYSKTCGTSDRLPNGNTLITESDNGRALEIAPDKTIVWEFYNPHRAGENNELIATLFELRRVDRDYVEWLDM